MRRAAWGFAALIALAVVVFAGWRYGPALLERARGPAAPIVEAAIERAASAPARGLSNGMRRPRAKACLQAAAVDLDGGDEMGAIRVGDGLDAGQINAAFGPYHDYLAGCQPVDGEDHSGSVVFELHVGCDGLVKAVSVTDDSLYEPAMIECLRQRLEYVEFPAHDLADGMYFEYPLIFHPPS